jgi:hypothetical protein
VAFMQSRWPGQGLQGLAFRVGTPASLEVLPPACTALLLLLRTSLPLRTQGLHLEPLHQPFFVKVFLR